MHPRADHMTTHYRCTIARQNINCNDNAIVKQTSTNTTNNNDDNESSYTTLGQSEEKASVADGAAISRDFGCQVGRDCSCSKTELLKPVAEATLRIARSWIENSKLAPRIGH